MAQASLSDFGWGFDVERGPDWLFVRPRRASKGASGARSLVEPVLALLEQHLTHRLVLELGDIGPLDRYLIGQLLQLDKCVHNQGGMLRVCELSVDNEEALGACGLENRFPTYRTCEDAVMGHAQPRQPR